MNTTLEGRRGYGFAELERMFGVSRDVFKRHATAGSLRTVTIGGRRVVPIDEVARIEREGLGQPRKKRSKVQQ